MTPIPESRPMSYSRGEITTFVMPHMQNMLGDLFGGHLMALVDHDVIDGVPAARFVDDLVQKMEAGYGLPA